MDFADSFLPTAASVGLLPMLTYFFMIIAAYAFVANFLFAVLGKGSVAPEHRVSRYFTAMIAAVAGISYFLITHFYHSVLKEVAHTADPVTRDHIFRTAYNAVGQLRYMDWLITTPLLLLKMVAMLKVQPHQAKSTITWLLLGDVFMIITGYIGEQQLDASGDILVAPKLIWGAVSTVGYVVVLLMLSRIWKNFKEKAKPEERTAFKYLALGTVTTWGVYPIGYILTTLRGIDVNYIHIAFSVADVVNKVGAGFVAYLAAKRLIEERVPEDAVMDRHIIS